MPASTRLAASMPCAISSPVPEETARSIATSSRGSFGRRSSHVAEGERGRLIEALGRGAVDGERHEFGVGLEGDAVGVEDGSGGA